MPPTRDKRTGRPVHVVDELILPVLHPVSALQMVLTSLVQLQSLLIDARFPNAERQREWADSMQGLSGNIDEAYRVVSTVTDQLVGIARRKGHDV
jgi:hypothetical protein